MKFLIFILFFALAGCADDQLRSQNEQLKYQNEQLRKKINEGYYEAQAQILRYERVAAEYEACRGFIDVCPSSVRDLGEKAIQAGYSGGSDRFWWLLALKMAILIFLVVFLYVLGSFAMIRMVQPAEEELQKARKKIENADELANLAEKRASEADRERQKVERKIEQLKSKETNLQTEIDELQSIIESLNDDITKLKVAHDAFADL
jgi:cytochrome c-type biogenesis protein CcmH/NrfG